MNELTRKLLSVGILAFFPVTSALADDGLSASQGKSGPSRGGVPAQ